MKNVSEVSFYYERTFEFTIFLFVAISGKERSIRHRPSVVQNVVSLLKYSFQMKNNRHIKFS